MSGSDGVFLNELPGVSLSNSAMTVLKAAEAAGRLTLVNSVEELAALAAPEGLTRDVFMRWGMRFRGGGLCRRRGCAGCAMGLRRITWSRICGGVIRIAC